MYCLGNFRDNFEIRIGVVNPNKLQPIQVVVVEVGVSKILIVWLICCILQRVRQCLGAIGVSAFHENGNGLEAFRMAFLDVIRICSRAGIYLVAPLTSCFM